MHYSTLGPFDAVSRLTLGGGGIGGVWGATNPEAAAATLYAAIDAGVTMIDTAPMYHTCEAVIAAAFTGALPAGVRITTKCQLGEPPAGSVAGRLEASLNASLAAMRLERVDIFFLHSNICEADTVYVTQNNTRAAWATPWPLYVEEVVPAMEALKRRGRIGAWGITGVGVPATILKAISHEVKPDVVQAVTNLMNSAGGMRRFSGPARPREIIAAARARGVGVMGIRAVQAGALTIAMDRDLKDSHPDSADYRRAAPFRALCADLGVDPALLAHRYALSLAGVDTLVLGVKNEAELAQCLAAEAQGPLSVELLARIEGLGLAGE